MATSKRSYEPIDAGALHAAFEDGVNDAGGAFDYASFEQSAAEGGTLEEIFDRAWTENGDGFDDWIANTDYNPKDPRAREIFERWEAGWKAGALPMLKESIDEAAQRELDDHEMFYLYDSPAEDVPVERFDNLDEALLELARVPVGSLKVGDANGPERTIIRVKHDQISPAFHHIMDAVTSIPRMVKFEKARTIASRNGWKRVNPSTRRTWNNPAWVTKTLAKSFEDLEDSKIPKQWLPRLQTVGAHGERITASAKEFGCGAYGCVLPTMDPKIVLKVTTDDTEAEFAMKLAKTLVVPVCTKYFAAMKIGEEHDGRPITLLWREEAKDIGEMKGEADELVANQHEAAQLAYELILGFQAGQVDATEMMAAVAAWTDSLEAMRWSDELAWLADGLLKVYAEQGIFFGDLHAGNIGKCERDGELRWVVTDPGHISVVASTNGNTGRAQRSGSSRSASARR